MKTFVASFVGHPIACVDQLASWPEFQSDGKIDVCDVDSKAVDSARWQAVIVTAKTDAMVYWEGWVTGGVKTINYRPQSEVVTVCVPNCFDTLAEVLQRSAGLSFNLASFQTTFQKQWMAADYPRWGFGRSMIDHGWGCAFRGAGHDRLVSRRWLDFGPWRVIRRPNDTTFIQFHDLDLTDPAAAYAQAAPGHERMGNSKIGGFLQHNLTPLLGYTSGLYNPASRTLEIVIGPGNAVEQREMLLACAERQNHRLNPPPTDRIDTVAYVFMARADAEAHLHELWLRELQCWYVDERGKHRLDDNYHPTPTPPAWVVALNQRDADNR